MKTRIRESLAFTTIAEALKALASTRLNGRNTIIYNGDYCGKTSDEVPPYIKTTTIAEMLNNPNSQHWLDIPSDEGYLVTKHGVLSMTRISATQILPQYVCIVKE
jgi:hypothetical protein